MVSPDVPQIEDKWQVQLSNDKVRIIMKFPEIPVGGRLSLHERLEENNKRSMGIRNYSEGLQVRISDENGIQGNKHTRVPPDQNGAYKFRNRKSFKRKMLSKEEAPKMQKPVSTALYF